MKQSEYHIPQRFIDAVAGHLVMNVIDMPLFRPPLILAIHGPVGEGKTEQCRIIFDRMRVGVEWMSADQFENEKAGKPAELLALKYKELLKFNLLVREGYETQRKLNHPSLLAVLFINDIDQRIGRHDTLIQQTINTQLINALLMGYTDVPGSFDGRSVGRVPIVVTGNNLGVIHKPLLRDGRAEKFEWKPTPEEKTKVVQRIFPELRDEDIWELVSKFASSNLATGSATAATPNFSVSSFAMLRYHIYKLEVLKMIHEVGLEKILDYVLSGKHQQRLKPSLFTPEALHQAAEELIRSDMLLDHLEG